MDGDNARHALQVLRYSEGTVLTVCDGGGIDYSCVVKSAIGNSLVLEILERWPNENEPSSKIYLFQALLKSDKLDYIIQKAVELGVCGIFPFESRNCTVKISSADKTPRRAKISEAAAKQSGRGIIPPVSPPLSFLQAIREARRLRPVAALAAHEKSAIPLKNILRGERFTSAAVFIGPEGGFTDSEAAEFAAAGIALVTLGRRVLRAETAALAVLANVFYELGE
jgi:16S rRNA (uracil1498-N3)-methyltransferase